MAVATIPGYPRIGKHRELKRALGVVLGRQIRCRIAPRHRDGDHHRWLANPARCRHRPDSGQRFLVLRPDARYPRPARPDPGPLPVRRGRGRHGHLLRDGAWPHWRPRCAGHGNDQVVRHELPLHRARDRTGLGLPAERYQAIRHARRGETGRSAREGRPGWTGHLPFAREVADPRFRSTFVARSRPADLRGDRFTARGSRRGMDPVRRADPGHRCLPGTTRRADQGLHGDCRRRR